MSYLTPLHSLVSDPKDPNSTANIIVCGGGMAGLTFARALFLLQDDAAKFGEPLPQVSITILERDPGNAEKDAQGYSLSLRADKIGGGIQALEQIGLLDEIKKGAAPGHRIAMTNEKFVPFCEMPSGSTAPSPIPNKPPVPMHIRIARKNLRNTLLNSLPTDRCTVQWGAHATKADTFMNEEGKEQVRVSLADGKALDGDLLIVADGAKSSIRRHLFPEESLEYAGCVAYLGETHFPNGIPPLVAKRVVIASNGQGQGVVLAPVDDNKIVFSVSYGSDKKIKQEYRADKKPLTQAELETFIAEASHYAKGFGSQSELNSYIANVDPKTIRVINAQDKKPHANAAHPHIILIGDASHAVSPFAGNGANMAIIDGLELAQQLVSKSHGGDLKAAVKAYDDRSIPRCNRSRGMSHFNIALRHSTGFKHKCWIHLFKLMLFATTRPKTAIAAGSAVLLSTAFLTVIVGIFLWNNYPKIH